VSHVPAQAILRWVDVKKNPLPAAAILFWEAGPIQDLGVVKFSQEHETQVVDDLLIPLQLEGSGDAGERLKSDSDAATAEPEQVEVARDLGGQRIGNRKLPLMPRDIAGREVPPGGPILDAPPG